MNKCTSLLAVLVVLLTGTRFLQAQTPPEGIISFAVQLYLVAESSREAVITLHLDRNPDSQSVLGVRCYTVNGTATEDDYQPVSTAVAFAPGETTKIFTVPILEDFDDEPNETIILVLADPTCGAALPGGAATVSALLMIIDNEFNPGELTFSSAEYIVSDTNAFATVTVTRSRGSSGLVSLQYYTEDGSAVAGLDYGAVSGTLSFADGETNKTFTVPILKDALMEADETFYLILTNATGGARFPDELTSQIGAVTIVDSDTAAVSRPLIADYERHGSTLAFRFTGEPSYDYFVEFSESCLGQSWLSLTNFRAKNQTIEAIVTDSVTNAATRFYRIRKQNCFCD